MAPTSLSIDAARRIAIRAHGLAARRPPGRVDKRHVRSVFDQIGLIQIDSVNVLARSHHLVLYSRLGAHNDDTLLAMARDSEVVEGWVHEATFLPSRHHHLFDFRRAEARDLTRVRQQTKDWVTSRTALIDDVRRQVADRGPITAGDLEQPTVRRGPWWGWSDAKFALEWLFRTGELGAFRGPQFERRYDLMDRVLPPDASRAHTPRDEAHRALIELATRHLGVGTAADIADYHRLLKTEVQSHLNELVDAEVLSVVEVEGWAEPAYMLADTTRARGTSLSALVSPFDPLTWFRPRGERLFDFRYRIEIYVPKPKRIYGYYVLPFLHRNRIRARVDLKHDRKSATLWCRAAWSEASDDDPADTARALAEELRSLASHLGASALRVDDAGDLAPELATHT